MKTAVLYSGQARSFAKVFENQWWHVLRKLPEPEFFVSVADDEQAPDMYRLLERFPADKVHIEIVQQPTLPEPPLDKPYLAMYPPSSPPQAILRQLWALQRVWEFYCESTSTAHDLIVRIRPDLAFYRFEMPGSIIPECRVPWWARWGGVNDRLALLGHTGAFNYFRTYERMLSVHKDKGCPLHPETLIAASLELGGITPSHTLATEFATVRLDGTVVPPSVSLTDQVEYARTKL